MQRDRDVVVVRYNAGNVRSVLCALSRLGVDARVSDDPTVLRDASHVIFPGVGEASTAMRYLRETGLDAVLRSLSQPFLGICLGMQLMCGHSTEHDVDCLGMFASRVVRFPDAPGLKVPHMGWNTIDRVSSSLFDGLPAGSWFYFVHSYYAEVSEGTTAACAYGDTVFSAALGMRNFHGVQFHPEKSGGAGARVLRNFLAME